MDYSHKIKFRIADISSEDLYNTSDEILKGIITLIITLIS